MDSLPCTRQTLPLICANANCCFMFEVVAAEQPAKVEGPGGRMLCRDDVLATAFIVWSCGG